MNDTVVEPLRDRNGVHRAVGVVTLHPTTTTTTTIT